MIPFVIIWNINAFEYFDENYFGHVENLHEIINIINNLMIEIINTHEKKINYHIKCDELNWEFFCEIVNNKPYCNNVFFEIKYFDISMNKWNVLEFDDIVLEKNFIKLINNLLNKKIYFSNNITDKFDKININKYNNILKQKNIKQILSIEL